MDTRGFKIYKCVHGHEKYSQDEPVICNLCGSSSFKLVSDVRIPVEDIYVIPEKSENDNSEE